MCKFEPPITVLVLAADGTVIRQRSYKTESEANDMPTIEELIAGCSCKVLDGHSAVILNEEPINPKVLPLVKAMFAADVTTTASGDLYGDDLVYIDLADEWEGAAVKAALPEGWVVSANSVNQTMEALGLPQDSCFPLSRSGLYESFPKIRLSRRGGAVTPKEAADVVASLQADLL